MFFSWTEKAVNLDYKIGLSFLIVAIGGGLIWMYIFTFYTLTEKEIQCTTGPFKKNISIESIQKLEITKNYNLQNSYWATATKGILIYYNQSNTIYISPEFDQNFIKNLVKINPDIQIS